MLNPDERRRRLRMMIIFLIVLACVLAFIYDVERPHSGPGAGAVSEVHHLAGPNLPITWAVSTGRCNTI
jgi:hypothetical protein